MQDTWNKWKYKSHDLPKKEVDESPFSAEPEESPFSYDYYTKEERRRLTLPPIKTTTSRLFITETVDDDYDEEELPTSAIEMAEIADDDEDLVIS